MEMFGAAIVLLGLLTLILSSVILIISIIKNQKSKLVSGLILLTSIILMALGAGIMSIDSPSGKQQAKEEPPTKEILPDDEMENATTPVTNVEDEPPESDSEREYYLKELAPTLDKLMLDFDDAWTNHWQVPFGKLGRSEISLDEVKQNLTALDEKYYDLREILDPLIPTSLSDENSTDFEEYKIKFMAAITGRMFVADNTIKAIDEGTLNDSHVKSSMVMIEMADEDLLASVAHWTVIKQRLGLLNE